MLYLIINTIFLNKKISPLQDAYTLRITNTTSGIELGTNQSVSELTANHKVL